MIIIVSNKKSLNIVFVTDSYYDILSRSIHSYWILIPLTLSANGTVKLTYHEFKKTWIVINLIIKLLSIAIMKPMQSIFFAIFNYKQNFKLGHLFSKRLEMKMLNSRVMKTNILKNNKLANVISSSYLTWAMSIV
jgi:hypothetical protein